MKKKLSLPSFLRAFFNVSYYVIAAVIALGVLMILIGSFTALGRDGSGSLHLPVFHDFPLTVRGKPAVAHTKSSSARDVEVTEVVTQITVNALSSDPALASLARWTILPPIAVLVVGALVSFRLLRDLCGRIEQGELLSEENLRAVRNLGFLSVGCSLFEFIVQACSWHFLGGYLARHATLSGINATFDPGLSAWPLLSGGLIEGLIILLLSEAFRQGLVLKQEADLTV